MPRSSNPFASGVDDAPSANSSNPFASGGAGGGGGGGSNPFASAAASSTPTDPGEGGSNPFASGATNPFENPPQDDRGGTTGNIGKLFRGKIGKAVGGGGDNDDDSVGSGGRGQRPPVRSSAKVATGRDRAMSTEPTGGVGGVNVGKMTAWLRGNKQDEEESDEYDEFGKKKKKKKKKKIQRWPYDDFHVQQQKYYDELVAKEKDGKAADNTRQSVEVPTMNDQIYQRPDELQDIKETVQNLNLVDFEKKAEERAIVIVSTWLFDSGLIDELLVSAGAGGGRGDVGEGVEVSAGGFPVGVDGALKAEKEIEKLRNATMKELSVINTRLNEGVAASGAEVQELVNAVEETKGELARLRQLSSYIIDGGTKNGDSNVFFLARYPKLKLAINARRNIFRVFRELEFFSQIPATCHRLKDELHAEEYTEKEWSSIRKVAMEHVELEMLLVEAEAGIKARIAEEEAEEEASQLESEDGSRVPARMLSKKISSRGPGRFGGSSFRSVSGNEMDVVDKFLGQHIKHVWELGSEIEESIMGNLGKSFDLAINNPAGLVALIEAVEVYERAAEQYKEAYGERQSLKFTDIKSKALSEIYRNFEEKGIEVFQDIKEGENAEESEIFSAVLNASTGLVAQIESVKMNMAPCFPPDWAIETLWSSCVAHVCSKQIMEQIGGQEGTRLPELSASQLLDLVAWVETFRDQIEETFPHIAKIQESKKTYFDEKPELFQADNKKQVDMEVANDSLAWVNNMLWEVHRLAQDDFLMRTRQQTDEWLGNVFNSEINEIVTADGKLTSSLCEDVFSIVGVQLRTLREHLSKKSDALIMACCTVFSQLRSKQMLLRDKFLKDLESCCTAANDFNRMSEKCEENMDELLAVSEFSNESIKTLQASSDELLAVYASDAVHASKMTHKDIFDSIRQALEEDMLTPKWEEEFTQNELADTLVKTLEDYMQDLERYLDPIMINKAIEGLVQATTVFYVRCLLQKSEKHTGSKPYFKTNEGALKRMDGDIKILRDYFQQLSKQFPVIQRAVQTEFETFMNIREILNCAATGQPEDALDYIIVMHKKIMDVVLTKRLFADLWHLVKPTDERAIWDLFETMDDELRAFDAMGSSIPKTDRSHVPGLRLNEMVAQMMVVSKRKVPIKNKVLEELKAEVRTTWKLKEEA